MSLLDSKIVKSAGVLQNLTLPLPGDRNWILTITLVIGSFFLQCYTYLITGYKYMSPKLFQKVFIYKIKFKSFFH